MKQKRLLLKIGFVLILCMAALHTVFIIIGGPEFPKTTDFENMFALMANLKFDTGGGIERSMQDILDGFNRIVSIFLITLPLLSWIMLNELKESPKGVRNLTIVNLLAVVAFFVTSYTYLAIGGTVIAAIVSLLFIVSLIIKGKEPETM